MLQSADGCGGEGVTEIPLITQQMKPVAAMMVRQVPLTPALARDARVRRTTTTGTCGLVRTWAAGQCWTEGGVARLEPGARLPSCRHLRWPLIPALCGAPRGTGSMGHSQWVSFLPAGGPGLRTHAAEAGEAVAGACAGGNGAMPLKRQMKAPPQTHWQKGPQWRPATRSGDMIAGGVATPSMARQAQREALTLTPTCRVALLQAMLMEAC